MRRTCVLVLLAVLPACGLLMAGAVWAARPPPAAAPAKSADPPKAPTPGKGDPTKAGDQPKKDEIVIDPKLLEPEEAMKRKTAVTINGQAFQINGRPTYRGQTFGPDKWKIEGLLMNARMVQGIFDDRNPDTRGNWKYPDGPWDPERNTHEFINAIPYWRQHGLLAFTVNLQGGNPQGYGNDQPWHNSAMESDGSLRTDYLARLEQIIDKADELGMVVILGYFYFGQDERVWDERSVIRAAENVTDWLLEKRYTNVLVEICNECNVRQYDHEILKPTRVVELIELVQKRSEGKVDTPAGRLLVSVSMGGGTLPTPEILLAGDFALLHGNGVAEPDGIRRMVKHTRGRMGSKPKPVLFNEDDHFDFDAPDNHMLAAVSQYASWGYFDYRMKGEDFDEGYQSVPVNWDISSLRKFGFFNLLSKITARPPPHFGSALRKRRDAQAAKEKAKAKAATGAKGETGPAGEAAPAGQAADERAVLETPHARLLVSPSTGAYEIADTSGGVAWRSSLHHARFGQVRMRVDGKAQDLDLGRCDVKKDAESLELTFHPIADKADRWVRVTVRPADGGKSFDIFWDAADPAAVERIRLLDDALWTMDAEDGAMVVPVREGLLIPADSGKGFVHTFDTYAYEGCHMQMVGVMKGGAAALVTWDDPNVTAEVRSLVAGGMPRRATQVLSLSLVLSKTARRLRLSLLGKGDYVTIARAYRDVARQRGWLVTWDEKLKGHPERARYFGAANYKLWSTLSRQMNDESTKEESVTVNWTFDEAAQVAEHLKNDLKLDRVLFIMGGWIHRGYDNQHPDVLPAAPECGGDEKFAECCRRIRALGYVLSLHDNYQDIYRDAPSWDEKYIMRDPGGALVKGGKWAGGRAYLTCSKMALELARRPQNLEAVRKLTGADSYFIDTTYAAGLQECFAKEHPLTRADDMKWKQALSDYAREVFGSFGSECGREWAIPHADFFEGLTGVSGTYYHDAGLLARLGAAPVPLFEMVYRDTIALYGKYGYDVNQAAEYVLDHISIGRPLNYHSIPPHLYWKGWSGKAEPAAVAPKAAEVRPKGARQFEITYHWAVAKPVAADWWVFVHFTDPAGTQIRFQNDHVPEPATSKWPVGDSSDGPFTVTVPEGMEGDFDVRVGFFSKPSLGRVSLSGESDNERRYTVGKLKVAGGKIEFAPVAPQPVAAAGDPALFTRAEGGWADGLHPMDIFVKNTCEVLSPLNEITSRVVMVRHEFLTPDRKVRRTVFGEGAAAVETIVNLSRGAYRCASKAGGEAILPPYGFLVEGPTFVAFCASNFGGVAYASPAMFAVRSLDGKPIAESAQVRIFHGFGDPRIRIAGAEHTVPKETTVKAAK